MVTRIDDLKAPAKAEPAKKAAEREVGPVEEPGDLHAPVLRHDRRRPAARAVPRHPRQAGAAQGVRRRTSSSVRADVEAGAALADAMKKHPKAFDALYSNMIAAGEAGGILDTILKRLARLHREERQAEGAGQVGDDLPDRRHLSSRRSSSRRFCGRSSRPSRIAVRRPRRAAAAADARRHRDEQRARRLRPDHRHRARADRLCASSGTTRRTAGRYQIDALMLKAPILGDDPAQDRGRAVLPHAVDAALVGRADPRRPRHHRPHGRQRRDRGGDPEDAHQHRARRDRLGAAARDQRVPVDGRPDDQRRRDDRRARRDAARRSRTSTRKKSTRRWPAC